MGPNHFGEPALVLHACKEIDERLSNAPPPRAVIHISCTNVSGISNEVTSSIFKGSSGSNGPVKLRG